jgi:hypothetical protein
LCVKGDREKLLPGARIIGLWELDECPHYLTFEEYDQHKRGLCTRQSKCEQLKERRLCPY